MSDAKWTVLAVLTCCACVCIAVQPESTEPFKIFITPTAATVHVPPSFLGLSHEPLTMAKHVLPTPQYQAFIKLLNSFDTGPIIIRWGGNEQDKLLEQLDDDQWISMRDLHRNTGTRFMIGLNLKARDPQLAAAQVSNAMRFLPPQAVLAFNIGNEADAFTFRDNKTIFPADYWREGWFRDVTTYCDTLAPLLLRHFNTTKIISGPASADMTQWKDPQAKLFTALPPLNQYASMLTAHYYTYRSTSPGASYQTFLAESKLDLVHRRVRPWVRWAKAKGLHFRLDETNTLAISGLAGASDTLAAALFYVDYAMTMILAGVNGMNFHDSMCAAYSPIIFPSLCQPENAARGTCPDICGQPGIAPMIRAPYYGMLFIQMALSELPKMLAQSAITLERPPGAPHIKVHVLSAGGGAELRVVLVRKDGDQAVTVSLRIQGKFGHGSLSLLEGPSFTAMAPDMTLAGQKVSDMGEMTGKREVRAVDVTCSGDVSQYSLELPAASASLFIVRPSKQ